MSKLYFCEKNKTVWEITNEIRSQIIYKKDENGDFIEDSTGEYALEMENDKIKKKIWKKTIHVYEGFPSYGLDRKNMPSNEKDEYYINKADISE